MIDYYEIIEFWSLLCVSIRNYWLFLKATLILRSLVEARHRRVHVFTHTHTRATAAHPEHPRSGGSTRLGLTSWKNNRTSVCHVSSQTVLQASKWSRAPPSRVDSEARIEIHLAPAKGPSVTASPPGAASCPRQNVKQPRRESLQGRWLRHKNGLFKQHVSRGWTTTTTAAPEPHTAGGCLSAASNGQASRGKSSLNRCCALGESSQKALPCCNNCAADPIHPLRRSTYRIQIGY